MRFLVLAAAVAFATSSATFAAIPHGKESVLSNDQIAHGGGCRKSSPPGKCCHAGSKPFHCH